MNQTHVMFPGDRHTQARTLRSRRLILAYDLACLEARLRDLLPDRPAEFLDPLNQAIRIFAEEAQS